MLTPEQQAKIDEFLQLVLKNLEKNGFPDKAVSFSLEKMYESASQRGFSFNKIRELLTENGIATELTEQHVIFRAQSQAESEESVDLSAMAKEAQRMLQQMSPDQRAQIEKMMREMDPGDLEKIKQQWEGIPAAEKLRMMQDRS